MRTFNRYPLLVKIADMGDGMFYTDVSSREAADRDRAATLARVARGELSSYNGVAIPQNISKQGPKIIMQYADAEKARQEADVRANAAMEKNYRLESLDPLSQQFNFRNTDRFSRNSLKQYGKAFKQFVTMDPQMGRNVATVLHEGYPTIFANQAEFEAVHPEAAEGVKAFNDFAPIAMKAMGPIPVVGPGIAAMAEPYANAVLAHRVAREGNDAVRGFGKYQGKSNTARAIEGAYNMATPIAGKYLGKAISPYTKGLGQSLGVNIDPSGKGVGDLIFQAVNKPYNYGIKPAAKYIGKQVAHYTNKLPSFEQIGNQVANYTKKILPENVDFSPNDYSSAYRPVRQLKYIGEGLKQQPQQQQVQTQTQPQQQQVQTQTQPQQQQVQTQPQQIKGQPIAKR
jgi:hypothetical protein